MKSYQNPIGKDRLATIIFLGQAIKLRGCMQKKWPPQRDWPNLQKSETLEPGMGMEAVP